MDVDMDPRTSSEERRPSFLPRTSSSVYPWRRTTLPDEERNSVDDQMTTWSDKVSWHLVLKNADKDPKLMSMVLSNALTTLIEVLSTTVAKATTLAPMDETSFVKGLDVEERKEWVAAMRKGVEGRDWADLATRLLLRTIVSESSRIVPTVETPERQAKRLHDMFQEKFQGVADKNFIKGLDIYNEIYDPRRHFGRMIPLLQSSGTGKSRMVYEMGTKLPTLSICFREGERPDHGWPPNDLPARRFFLQRPNSEIKGEELAAAFLGALMHVLAEKIERRMLISSDPQDLMADWSLDDHINIQESSRYKSFAEVEAMSEKLLNDNGSVIRSLRMGFSNRDTPQCPSDWHAGLFRMLCRPYFIKLSRLLTDLKIKYLIIAFDECSQLNATPSGKSSWEPPSYMTLIALQRIIKASSEYEAPDTTAIWFLLLDTNPSVYGLAPLGDKVPSKRLTGGFRILPPWHDIGFNQMAPKKMIDVIGDIKLPSDVLTIDHLKRYGRPYWALLSQREAPRAAYEKLFPERAFLSTNADHVFAAFAIRAGLEIGEGEASEHLAIEAVRSHMRILRSIVGPLVNTTSPSEPILAIAAAEALNESKERYEKAINTLLHQLILKGVVRMTGEFVSRLIWTMVRDKATISTGGPGFVRYNEETNSYFVPAVRLSTLLRTLLGDNLGISDDFTQQSIWRDGLLLKADEVWVNFTHFVQLSVPIDGVTPAMLLEAWSSGFAFQCVFRQPVIDGLIVAYYGKLDEPFDISKLFVVPWHTKTRSDAADLSLSKALAAPFLAMPDQTVRRKPWTVVILLDLAVASAVPKRNGSHCELMYGSAESPTRKQKGGSWGGYAQTGEVEGIRYCLNICGHRAMDYPVLRGLEEQFDQLFKRTQGCIEPEFIPFAAAMDDAMERITSDSMT